MVFGPYVAQFLGRVLSVMTPGAKPTAKATPQKIGRLTPQKEAGASPKHHVLLVSGNVAATVAR